MGMRRIVAERIVTTKEAGFARRFPPLSSIVTACCLRVSTRLIPVELR